VVRRAANGGAHRVVGLPVHLEAAPLDLVAEVLATIDGDPMRLIDGEPLREQ
jgi:hypothetical protein